MRRTVVIGAGPAGLAAAHVLSRAGVSVTVYEAGASVGGLARSLPLWGQSVDLGPHLLQLADPRIERLWRNLIRQDYEEFARLTRIVIGGHWLSYPYQPREIVRSLGPRRSIGLAADALLQRLRPNAAGGDVESWAVSRVGNSAFDLLFRGYLEKLFGLAASDLDQSFGESLVGAPARGNFLLTAVRTLVIGSARQPHDLIVRPRGGIGILQERLAADVVAHGGEIRLAAPIAGVRATSAGGIELRFRNGRIDRAEVAISTIPLPLLVRTIDKTPAQIRHAASSLRARSALLVYLRVSPPPAWREQWIFVMEHDYKLCRITNFSNFSAAPAQATEAVLVGEYWGDAGDSTWHEPDELLASTTQAELLRLGLLGPQHQVIDSHVVRIARAFPIPLIGNQEVLSEIGEYLKTIPQLRTVGRFSSFSNEGVHSSLLMGIQAAEELLGAMRRPPRPAL